MDQPDAPAADAPPVPAASSRRAFDTILAVCAIFISAVSLIVAIGQGRTERELVAASTWPFLSAEETNSKGTDQDIAIGAINSGVGPAKVHSFEVFLDGRPVGSPWELLSRCCGLPADAAAIRRLLPPGAVYASMIDDTVMRPSDADDVLLLARAKADPALFARFNKAMADDRLRFRACYCSSLDECWTGGLVTLDVARVRACPAPAHPYRYNAWLPGG